MGPGEDHFMGLASLMARPSVTHLRLESLVAHEPIYAIRAAAFTILPQVRMNFSIAVHRARLQPELFDKT